MDRNATGLLPAAWHHAIDDLQDDVGPEDESNVPQA